MGIFDKVGSFIKREADDLGDAAEGVKDKFDQELTKREQELEMTPSEKIAALQQQAAETDSKFDAIADKAVGREAMADAVAEVGDLPPDAPLPNVTHIVLPDGRVKSGDSGGHVVDPTGAVLEVPLVQAPTPEELQAPQEPSAPSTSYPPPSAPATEPVVGQDIAAPTAAAPAAFDFPEPTMPEPPLDLSVPQPGSPAPVVDAPAPEPAEVASPAAESQELDPTSDVQAWPAPTPMADEPAGVAQTTEDSVAPVRESGTDVASEFASDLTEVDAQAPQTEPPESVEPAESVGRSEHDAAASAPASEPVEPVVDGGFPVTETSAPDIEPAEPAETVIEPPAPAVEVDGAEVDGAEVAASSATPDYGKTPAQIKYEQARAAANDLLDELRGELKDEGEI